MDRRLIFAAALSVAILVVWNWLVPQPRPPAQLPAAAAPVAAALPDVPEPRGADEPDRDDRPAAAVAAERIEAATEDTIEIDNGVFRVALSNRGAGAVSWRLTQYTQAGGEPLELLPQFADLRSGMFTLDLGDELLNETVARALYRVERVRVSGEPGGERVSFRWSDGRGLEVTKSVTFRRDDYLVDLHAEVRDRGRPRPARLVLGPGFSAQERSQSGLGSYEYEAVVWNDRGHVTHRKKRKLSPEVEGVAGRIQWAGLEDQYFAAIAIPKSPQGDVVWWAVERVLPGAEADGKEPEPEKQPFVGLPLPPEGATLFVGPKKYSLLSTLGNDLQKSVWFSSNVFLAWISRHIFLGLLWIHEHTVRNYGMSIILATFLLRLLLFPVNQYSMVSMKKAQLQMQKLQPKIKGIRAKYKKAKDAESRGRMNQEMMDLYKREGVNPMGGLTGCLPLLAQFPILIAFYNMLTVAVELRGADFFGWIHDLSQRDPLWVLPLLMGGTMFLQQRMAMSKIKDPMQQQQQKIMMFMPVFFTWICLQMPSGMVLYWFVNNVLGIGQQWLVNRHTSRLEAAAQEA